MKAGTKGRQEKSTNVRASGLRWLVGAGAAVRADVTTAWAARRFLTPQRLHPRTADLKVTAAAERFTVGRPNQSVEAASWGDQGPTVLFVHGWNGHGAQVAPWVDVLRSRGFRVVTYDARGHGRSRGQRTNVVEMADTLTAVARTVGGAHTVIAHSLGAVAASIALSRGMPAERLVLVAPALEPRAWLRPFAQAVGLPAHLEPALAGRIEAQAGLPVDAIGLSTLAPRIEVPTLFVHDAGDRTAPRADVVSVVSRWPDGRLLPTEGLGHHRILRDPWVGQAVAAFAAGQHELLDAMGRVEGLREPNLARWVERFPD
jgi:pimeloyl-ACP methyl ester carboxylesterase